MELRSTVLHGFLRVQNKGQLLVLDLERANTLNCGKLCLRNDHSHVIPIITYVAVQKMPVRNVLMRRVHRPRMSRSREAGIGDVKAGKDFDYAFDRLCFRLVDRFYEAVRDRGMLDPDKEGVLGNKVLVILGTARDFVKSIDSNYAFTGFHKFFILLLQRKNFAKLKIL